MQNYRQTPSQAQLIFTALIFTSVLSVVAGMTFLDAAVADSATQWEVAQQPPVPDKRKLPDSIAKAVLQNAAQRSQLPTKALRILKAERKDWPNGCLGLAEPGRLCTQAVVPGWRVEVFSSQGTMVYHTNNSGSVVKLANSSSEHPFPPDIVGPGKGLK